MAEKQSNGNQKVSEQQVRREKLALLQEAGRDPFVQTKFTVTNFSTGLWPGAMPMRSLLY